MRRTLATLALAATLLQIGVAPAAATAPGWTHSRYVPEPVGAGWQCGVQFDSMTPTGYVDFWIGPTQGSARAMIQHWNGSMTFKVAGGSSVTLREDDWRYVTDTDYADGSGYSEVSTAIGLLEDLATSEGRARLTDAGTVTVKTENLYLEWPMIEVTSVKATAIHGLAPMRRSGFDLQLQGWNRECSFFAAHLGS